MSETLRNFATLFGRNPEDTENIERLTIANEVVQEKRGSRPRGGTSTLSINQMTSINQAFERAPGQRLRDTTDLFEKREKQKY